MGRGGGRNLDVLREMYGPYVYPTSNPVLFDIYILEEEAFRDYVAALLA